MSVPNRQIGWSNESNLLWQLSKQMDKLTGVTSANLSTIIADLATKVTNQLGTPSFRSDTLANLPTAGQTGRMFIATDTFAFYRDNGVGWDLIGGPGVGTVTGSGAATQVAFWNGTSVISGSSNLYWDSANNRLGVGTTSPATDLQISKAGSTTLRVTNTNNSTNVELGIATALGFVGTKSNNSFAFNTNDTERMRITSNGNVLVGTTTDAGYRLDVSGNIRSNNGLWVTNTLNPAVGVMTWGAFGGTNIQIGSWSLNTPVYFVLGSSPRMRLGGIAAGDVGQLTVGNVSSSDAPWVSTSYLLALGVSASLENNNEGSTFYSYNAYRSAGGLRYIASNPALSFGLDFNKFVWRSAASGTSGNLITFTESMTLDINGRLGIGATSPSYKLDVNGSLRSTADAYFATTSGNVGVGTTSPSYKFDVNGTGRFQYNNGVCLQIGITTPTFTIGPAVISLGGTYGSNVSGNTSNIKLRLYDDGGSTDMFGFGVSDTGSGRTLEIQSTQLITFYNGNTANRTERMRIDTVGGVGIGATSILPSVLLQLDSTTRGFLPPRQTQAQRTAIGSPATGLVVYQTDGVEDIYYNTSAGWQSITSNILTKFRIYNTFRL